MTERPAPGHLDVRLDEDKSLRGRWINSQDVREGDMLLSRSGRPIVVERVRITDVVESRVCNLTVRDYHTFLVGPDELLAHNQSWCAILKAKGWNTPPELLAIAKREGLDISRIHGHHIVMKEAMDKYSIAARKILDDYNISLLGTKEELLKLHFRRTSCNGVN